MCANKGTDLLLVLLLVAGPTLTLARAAPGRRGGPAACATGGAAAAEVPAGAGVVTGAAGNVAEHVVHESALLGDAVVEVSRDVHLASAVRGLLKGKGGRLNNMSCSQSSGENSGSDGLSTSSARPTGTTATTSPTPSPSSSSSSRLQVKRATEGKGNQRQEGELYVGRWLGETGGRHWRRRRRRRLGNTLTSRASCHGATDYDDSK